MAEIARPLVVTRPAAARSNLVRVLRTLLRNPAAALGLAALVAILLMAVFAPYLTSYDPTKISLKGRLEPGFWAGGTHLLGSDKLGRDIFSRTLYAGRVTLLVGTTVVVLTGMLGVLIGAVAGNAGGRIDMLLMRAVDLLLVLPDLVTALVIIAILGPGLEKTLIAVCIVYIPKMARIVRGAVLGIRSAGYVEAARCLGVPATRILLRHVLPNAMPPIIVYLTLLWGDAVLNTAALGFLGLGAQPPTPEWGAMLSDGRDYIVGGQWWVATIPGLAILITVLSFNLLGDALRDALDPRL